MEKWTLSHGCHRHTITSRDSGNPEHFDTKEEAITAYKQHREFYHSIGYCIWFAYLKSPDGEETILEQNPVW